MKLTVGEFEIDIKAKDARFRDRNNLMDTINFLNMASIAFCKAADAYTEAGYKAIPAQYQQIGDDLYAALKAVGAYKDV